MAQETFSGLKKIFRLLLEFMEVELSHRSRYHDIILSIKSQLRYEVVHKSFPGRDFTERLSGGDNVETWKQAMHRL